MNSKELKNQRRKIKMKKLGVRRKLNIMNRIEDTNPSKILKKNKIYKGVIVECYGDDDEGWLDDTVLGE